MQGNLYRVDPKATQVKHELKCPLQTATEDNELTQIICNIDCAWHRSYDKEMGDIEHYCQAQPLGISKDEN